MKIRVRKKEKPFAQVSKNLLFNQTLSIQAKGIGAIIECYSDNFELSNKSLEINANVHGDTLRKYLKELEKNFYLYRIQLANKQFKSIWFFDSERIDFVFIHQELEELKRYDKLVIVSDYEIIGVAENGTVKLSTYNNNTTELTNFDYMQIMVEVNKEIKKHKNSKGYVISPRDNKAKLRPHTAVEVNNALVNKFPANCTNNFLSTKNSFQNEEVEF